VDRKGGRESGGRHAAKGPARTPTWAWWCREKKDAIMIKEGDFSCCCYKWKISIDLKTFFKNFYC